MEVDFRTLNFLKNLMNLWEIVLPQFSAIFPAWALSGNSRRRKLYADRNYLNDSSLRVEKWKSGTPPMVRNLRLKFLMP